MNLLGMPNNVLVFPLLLCPSLGPIPILARVPLFWLAPGVPHVQYLQYVVVGTVGSEFMFPVIIHCYESRP